MKVKDKKHLINIIKYSKAKDDLNRLDISNITDLSMIFQNTNFKNRDISKWDVSHVESMDFMFFDSKINCDISNWDISNVRTMRYMFKSSKFNSDISKWNIRNVINTSNMFEDSIFNGDISKWDVSKVTNMTEMFIYSKFDIENILNWNFNKNVNLKNFSKEISKFSDILSIQRNKLGNIYISIFSFFINNLKEDLK